MHEDLEIAAYGDLLRNIISDLGMLRDNKSGTEDFSLRDILKKSQAHKRTQEAEFKSSGYLSRTSCLGHCVCMQ